MDICAVCHESNLTFGCRQDVGIVTLWTKKDHILKKLQSHQYGIVGQLYSRDEGISCLIRNCLSNKSIRHLVLCGIDLYNSGQALVALMKDGVDEHHKIIGVNNACVQKEIPIEAITTFRNHVQVHDLRHLRQYDELSSFIDQLPVLASYGEPEHFPDPQVQAVDSWPTDPVGFKVVGTTVGKAWLDILDTIMKFGLRKKTEYGNEMKEVINLLAVVTEEDPQQIKWEDYFNFTKEELQDYIPKILTNADVQDVEYTYGKRLRSHFGKDQIQEMIEYLKKVPHTRRAVAVTWDVTKDLGNTKAPCLDLIQCLVQDDKLWMTVYFRSNDMFDAWPRNALALRHLQGEIASALGLTLGSLCTLSSSAHIYEGSWTLAKKIIDDYYRLPPLELDPRGNFVISVEQGNILLKHYSPHGGQIDEISGITANDVMDKLLKKKSVSLISHALYLGKELQKAQTALEENRAYRQDQQLGEKFVSDSL